MAASDLVSVRGQVMEHTYIPTSLSQPPGDTFRKLSSDAIFVVCSHLLSSDWKRWLCLSKYLDAVYLYLCVPVLRWSLQFLVRVFTFFSLNLWFKIRKLYFNSCWNLCVLQKLPPTSIKLPIWFFGKHFQMHLALIFTKIEIKKRCVVLENAEGISPRILNT